MTARAGRRPGPGLRGLAERFGDPIYRQVDVAATPAEKAALGRLSAEQVGADELAGEPVLDVQTVAPGNGAPIGGVKVIAENAWFAARPSGTEDVYKVYAESYRGEDHLERILAEAERIVQGRRSRAEPSAQGPIVRRMAEISIGSVLGGYRIEGVAGEGGWGACTGPCRSPSTGRWRSR